MANAVLYNVVASASFLVVFGSAILGYPSPTLVLFLLAAPAALALYATGLLADAATSTADEDSSEYWLLIWRW